MDKVIAMTACRRPEYTRRVIESLRRCTNISGYKLVPFCDGPCESVIDVFKKIDFCEVDINVNETRLGHTLNTHKALSRGFELSDYVILLEDDTLLSKDFLEFHEFCREKFKDDKDIYTVSAGHYNEINREYEEEERCLYYKRSFFSNQGWGMWIDRWEESGGIKYNWEYPETVYDNYYQVNYKYGGWDNLMNKLTRKDRKEILAVVSRVKNIGAEEGVHIGFPPEYESFEDFHQKNIQVKDWCGLYELQGLEYKDRGESFLDFLME